MRIVIGTLGLSAPGGTETYCLTVAAELDRLGHEVTLFASDVGPFGEWMAASGFDIARDPGELPGACDAVYANDAISAGLLAERYPSTRLVYCVHSPVIEVQQPPLGPGIIDAVIGLSERFAAHARALALDVPVVRLRQPVDTESFGPTQAPRDRPLRALLLSSYLTGRRRDALVETWSKQGVECVAVGATERVIDPRDAIAEADIVVAKARAAIEGMACGKAVYVYDMHGGDGWVTADNYAALEADNFAGMATGRPIDRRRLAADLAAYDPDMGWINRELAVTHHGARAHAQGLLEVLRGGHPGSAEPASSAGAAARMARSAWRAHGRATVLDRHVADLRARVDQSAAELAAAAAQLAAARADAETATRQHDAAIADHNVVSVRLGEVVEESERWRRRAIDAEAERDGLRRLLDTRRMRAAVCAGRWLDRLHPRR